jgi:excisionase family DNA binding protein
MLKTQSVSEDTGVDLPAEAPNLGRKETTRGQGEDGEELPMTVKAAAIFLGVSVQTVYLWVERKQIPHLRVMGRNIRFLRSDLEPFRASFKQEVENGTTE